MALVLLVLVVHNAEEAVAFYRMWPRIGTLLPGPLASVEARFSIAAILMALAIVSLLACALTAGVVLRPQWRSGWWLLLALESAMAINVIAHVVSALLIFRGYGPGLITAVSLNAPFAAYCLTRGRRERWVSERAWRATFVGGAILHGPILLGVLWLAGTLT